MTASDRPSASVGQRIKTEMRAYLFISTYLWICFSIVLLYQGTAAGVDSSSALPFGLALFKALLIGKFILVGKAVGLGTRIQHSVLVHRIIWKSFAFLLLLIVFGWLEEFVVGLYHGETLSQIVSEIVAVPTLQKLSSSLLMLMVLIPMITFEEVDNALGGGELTRMLFSKSDS